MGGVEPGYASGVSLRSSLSGASPTSAGPRVIGEERAWQREVVALMLTTSMEVHRSQMSVLERLETAQYVVDADGNKTAVVLDYAEWEQLLTLLEDMGDAEEIRRLREAGEETISWEETKAELHILGTDP